MAEDSRAPCRPRTGPPLVLTSMPPEILLYICSFPWLFRASVLCALTYRIPVSYLDVPELSTLASTCHYLASLAADPILQRTRLLVIAPSRISHSLFAVGPEGSPLRPTISDLIRRGVMKGLDIERRWRAGSYLYSALARIPLPFCCALC
jgi:hypothetical protein